MTLRRRLLLACVALALLPAAGGVLTVWLLRGLGSTALSIYDNEIVGLTYICKAQVAFTRFINGGGDRAQLDLMIDTADIAAGRAVTARTLQDSLTIRILALVLRDADAADKAQLIDVIHVAFNTALRDFGTDGLRARDRAGDQMDQAQLLAGLIAGGITCLAIAIGLMVWRSVIPPLRQAVRIATAVAAGKLDNRIEAVGVSEPALLLRALDDMQSAIRDSLHAMACAAEEARRASDAKSNFLAMMSHEIRTPMNAVLGLTGSVLEGPLDPDQRATIEIIRGAGGTLMQLLNDILDLSKLHAGRMTLETVPFSPVAVTEEIISLLGPRAIEKGLTLDASYPDGQSLAVLGDAGRVRQILMNLLSNAVKFTETGSIGVTLAVTPRDSARDLVWTVRDTGIGIPANQLPGLFDEFTQADSSITRRFGGSGLGLAISKRLAIQMGGSIAVRSEPGAGSVFRVALTLPAALTTRQVDAEDAGDFGRWLMDRPARPRILIAEDNPTNQFVIRRVLGGYDMDIAIANDGAEAVRLAMEAAPDLILMDIQMPVMDGLAASRALRASGGALARVPIVALTANAYPEDIALCRAAGMDDFVAKPFTRPRLLAAIRQALPV